ncbi:M48 family metalloprotease [Haloferax prahovense]|uniref:M48 family metalloprotease n=1 Tax=Haloferax prahovense TaxID=381852 RepID=UPI000679D9C3|nr:M48 family metalloprotease [Haloferax prahovense]
MQAVDRVSNRFRDLFTRVFARLYHGPVESVSSFNGYSDDQDVYWFESNSAAFGQATPVGTIILNKQRMDNLSDEAAELVYRHEQGHLNRLPVFRGLFWGLILNGAIGIYYFLQSLGYSLLIPFGVTIEPVAMMVGVSLILILLMVGAARLEELAADLYALRSMGEEEFLTAYDEISEEGSDSLHVRIVNQIQYTDPENVVKFHRFLARAKTLYPA